MERKVTAFIPVRGGSKSIPLKNIKEIAGHPLVYYTVKAANDCDYIDLVYVATDSEKIREVVEGFSLSKVKVIGRSEESATDTASTESAMLEFAKSHDLDDIILIQATSPLLKTEDLNGGIKKYKEGHFDSLLSVVRQKRFNWRMTEDGSVLPSNYDPMNRPRRQEFDGYLVENGAFYITSGERLITEKSRLSGRMGAYEMSEETYFEIDEPSDFIISGELLKRRNKEISEESFADIKMFLTDCDGCLTDGGMYYSEKGDELKKFHTSDGVAFGLLRNMGIVTGIVTGEDRDLNRRRAAKLRIDVIKSGIFDKLSAIKELSEEYNIPLENIAYMGDDLLDVEAMKHTGISFCPKNGRKEAKEAATFITETRGGEGAFREAVEILFKIMHKKPSIHI